MFILKYKGVFGHQLEVDGMSYYSSPHDYEAQSIIVGAFSYYNLQLTIVLLFQNIIYYKVYYFVPILSFSLVTEFTISYPNLNNLRSKYTLL